MKIGLSFGKCVRDVVQGTVKMQDILVIVSATKIENREAIPGLVDWYISDHSRFGGLDQAQCLATCYQLWDAGKIFQPRTFTDHWSSGFGGVWADIIPTLASTDETVMDAWNSYMMVLGLLHGPSTQPIKNQNIHE